MPVKSNMIRESTVQLESISSDTNTKKDNAATQTQVEPSYPAWTGNHLSSMFLFPSPIVSTLI